MRPFGKTGMTFSIFLLYHRENSCDGPDLGPVRFGRLGPLISTCPKSVVARGFLDTSPCDLCRRPFSLQSAGLPSACSKNQHIAFSHFRRFFFFLPTLLMRIRQSVKIVRKTCCQQIPHHIMHEWSVPVSSQSPREAQQRIRHCPCHHTGHHGISTDSPSLFGPMSEDWRFPSCRCSGQLADEILGLPRPSAPNFHSEHHQPASRSWPHQLRVSPLFAASCCLQSHSRCVGCLPSLCNALTTVVSIASLLGSAKQRKPIRHDLKTSAICLPNQAEIELAEENVRGDSAACFTADSRDHTFKSVSPLAQDPCPCTCSAVVAKLIEWAATPARMHGQGKGQLETAQKEDPELLRFQLGDSAGGARSQRQTCA